MGKGGISMSKIDDLMKQLQEKKTVIEAYNLIADSLGKTLEDKKFDEIREDVSGKVAEFLISEIESVENGALQAAPIQSSPAGLEGLSPEQIQALAQVANKVMNKTTVQNDPFSGSNNTTAQPKQRRPIPPASQDKIRFALQNRHLENKEVSVTTENGVINGTVRGLDAPFVIVQTETGQTIDAPLESIQVKGA